MQNIVFGYFLLLFIPGRNHVLGSPLLFCALHSDYWLENSIKNSFIFTENQRTLVEKLLNEYLAYSMLMVVHSHGQSQSVGHSFPGCMNSTTSLMLNGHLWCFASGKLTRRELILKYILFKSCALNDRPRHQVKTDGWKRRPMKNGEFMEF